MGYVIGFVGVMALALGIFIGVIKNISDLFQETRKTIKIIISGILYLIGCILDRQSVNNRLLFLQEGNERRDIKETENQRKVQDLSVSSVYRQMDALAMRYRESRDYEKVIIEKRNGVRFAKKRLERQKLENLIIFRTKWRQRTCCMINTMEMRINVWYNGGTIMRVISRFETYGKKMITVMIGCNVSVMTERDYKWICNHCV